MKFLQNLSCFKFAILMPKGKLTYNFPPCLHILIYLSKFTELCSLIAVKKYHYEYITEVLPGTIICQNPFFSF